MNSYRGIIISSCICKLFLRVVAKRIEEFMSASGKWCVNQCGFKGDHRTEDSLFIINTLFDSYIKQQDKKLYVAFVDFSKNLTKSIERTYCINYGSTVSRERHMTSSNRCMQTRAIGFESVIIYPHGLLLPWVWNRVAAQVQCCQTYSSMTYMISLKLVIVIQLC